MGVGWGHWGHNEDWLGTLGPHWGQCEWVGDIRGGLGTLETMGTTGWGHWRWVGDIGDTMGTVGVGLGTLGTIGTMGRGHWGHMGDNGGGLGP